MNDPGTIRLELTCLACPEQYDAYDEAGNRVGYLRLRWGCFTVQCGDTFDTYVYEHSWNDEGYKGNFDEDEREYFLDQARSAIAVYLRYKD